MLLRAHQNPIDIYADATLAGQVTATDAPILQLEYAYSLITGQDPNAEAQRVWRITADTLKVTVDGMALAEQAYSVGRGTDFIPGRIKAVSSGVSLPAELIIDEDKLARLERLITLTLGVPTSNAGIVYQEGRFELVPSKPGYVVEHEEFTQKLEQAFLSDSIGEASIIVPMCDQAPLISNEEARELLLPILGATSQPVVFINPDQETQTWEFSAETLCSWIGTRIESTSDKTPILVAQVDAALLKKDLQPVVGSPVSAVAPVDPSFSVVGDKVLIIEGVDGIGFDYDRLASDLSLALFNGTGAAGGTRAFVIPVGRVAPELSVADLEARNITEKIASYTTEYPPDQANRVNNIHKVCDILNNTLIAPGEEWSFHRSAGNCTADRGFLPANAIDGSEYIEEVGGGICQVASTVYNVVLESGFPVQERVCHARYSTMYPLGRDATISYPYPDFKFINDSQNWLLLSFTYTYNTVTVTMWGMHPGYTVDFEYGEIVAGEKFTTREIENASLPVGSKVVIQEGMDGFSTTVTRSVHDSDGNLLRRTTFHSTYYAAAEIIEVGPKGPVKPG
ncbi:MAG: VanW family protein [Coriobacteriia bacterium]|nr:VanW family protein [Coriobacteriia bacterium]